MTTTTFQIVSITNSANGHVEYNARLHRKTSKSKKPEIVGIGVTELDAIVNLCYKIELMDSGGSHTSNDRSSGH